MTKYRPAWPWVCGSRVQRSWLGLPETKTIYTWLFHPGLNNAPMSWVVGKASVTLDASWTVSAASRDKTNQKLLLTKESVAFKRREGVMGVQSGRAGHQKDWHAKNPSWQSGFQLIKQRKTSFREDNPIGSTCKIFPATFCLLELQLKAI